MMNCISNGSGSTIPILKNQLVKTLREQGNKRMVSSGITNPVLVLVGLEVRKAQERAEWGLGLEVELWEGQVGVGMDRRMRD